MKWALVIAGIADFARPAENLSLTQNIALTCTGLIWTRWCLIIKPKNYLYDPPFLPVKPLVPGWDTSLHWAANSLFSNETLT